MLRWIKALLCTLGLCTAAPGLAAGPLDGEAALFWWANDVNADFTDGEIDAGSLGGFGELWWNQGWGLKGALYRSDLEEVGLDSEDHFSIDVKRRLLSPTDNTFLALGLGWESIDMAARETSDGFRLMLEGRVGIAGALSFYGQTAWFPSLDDAADRSDIDGSEFEAGVSFDPLPFFSLHAGYRKFKLDFVDDITGSNSSARSSGLIFGAGLHW